MAVRILRHGIEKRLRAVYILVTFTRNILHKRRKEDVSYKLC